jgi:hypothetical protein
MRRSILLAGVLAATVCGLAGSPSAAQAPPRIVAAVLVPEAERRALDLADEPQTLLEDAEGWSCFAERVDETAGRILCRHEGAESQAMVDCANPRMRVATLVIGLAEDAADEGEDPSRRRAATLSLDCR